MMDIEWHGMRKRNKENEVWWAVTRWQLNERHKYDGQWQLTEMSAAVIL